MRVNSDFRSTTYNLFLLTELQSAFSHAEPVNLTHQSDMNESV